MKICLRANLYYNVGVAETVYHYYLAANRMGVDFKIAGFIEDRITEFIPPIGEPLPIDPNEINQNGEDYHLNRDNSKDIDLFIFYFDSQNPFIGERGESELEKIARFVPREKSVIIDADGKANPTIRTTSYSNHKDEKEREEWLRIYDIISDRILQPTFKPISPKAEPFLFWGYEELEEQERKEYDVIYLGSNWYRWDRREEFMHYFEGIREFFPRLAVIGSHWITSDPYMPSANKHKPSFFEESGIDVKEYVTEFGEFKRILGGSRFSPILVRPILGEMELFTPRMLETFASGTIPIIPSHFYYSEQLYGERATELILGDDPVNQLKDMAEREDHYHQIAKDIRNDLSKYSYESRIKELISKV